MVLTWHRGNQRSLPRLVVHRGPTHPVTLLSTCDHKQVRQSRSAQIGHVSKSSGRWSSSLRIDPPIGRWIISSLLVALIRCMIMFMMCHLVQRDPASHFLLENNVNNSFDLGQLAVCSSPPWISMVHHGSPWLDRWLTVPLNYFPVVLRLRDTCWLCHREEAVLLFVCCGAVNIDWVVFISGCGCCALSLQISSVCVSAAKRAVSASLSFPRL